MKKIITFSLDPELITWIDEHRGQTPRSTFVNGFLLLNAAIQDARKQSC